MKDKKGEHPYGDTGQILGALFFIIWLADSLILKKSTFLSGYIPFLSRVIIFAVSIITSLILFTYGHVVIKNENRPVSVISNGVFKYIRHPLYLSSLLFYFGLFISTVSIFSFGLLIIIFIFYDYIAGYEEEIMVVKSLLGFYSPRLAADSIIDA